MLNINNEEEDIYAIIVETLWKLVCVFVLIVEYRDKCECCILDATTGG